MNFTVYSYRHASGRRNIITKTISFHRIICT